MKNTNVVLIDCTAGTAGPEFTAFLKKSILLSLKRHGLLTDRQCEDCIRHISEKKR